MAANGIERWRMPPAHEAASSLARRPWTRAERRVVWQGLLGRLLIAIEPIICTLVFGALTVALIFFPLPASKLTRWESAIVVSPVFGIATLAFLGYAIAVLVPPIRALLHTFAPIYIVDGYIRHRGPDLSTECDSNGYVAVLDERRRALAEWPSIGASPLPKSQRPAMVEFSLFGGIHRIDGRSTGVLPETIGALGVGAGRL